MAAHLIDLTGRRFGRRVVLRRAENSKRGAPRWVVLCDCGTESVVLGGGLLCGALKSCGCVRRETGCTWLIKHPAAVIARIHELRKQGLGYDRISRALEVPKSTVRDVIKGLTRVGGRS